jgi:DNA-binding transcriptional MerR regulator
LAKGPNAFRTISEAADELGVPQHVLRFWETRFTFISPMKRAGGRRFYRPQDIVVLAGVRRLLHDEGLTIKGVQKLHKDQGLKVLLGAGQGLAFEHSISLEDHERERDSLSDEGRVRLTSALSQLLLARERLDLLLAERAGVDSAP